MSEITRAYNWFHKEKKKQEKKENWPLFFFVPDSRGQEGSPAFLSSFYVLSQAYTT